MSKHDWEAEACKLIIIAPDEDGRPLYYAWLGNHLLEGNEYEDALEGVRDDIAPVIAAALQRAYDRGREDVGKHVDALAKAHTHLPDAVCILMLLRDQMTKTDIDWPKVLADVACR